MSVMARFRLDGRSALVTGGSRGIGRAIAMGLAECGADVAVHYAGNEAAARETVGAIAALGRRAVAVRADLDDDDAPARIADAALAGLGKIDVLVLNASVQFLREWHEPAAHEEWDRQWVVNLRSAYELMGRCVPGMVERGWGRVLTIGSVQQQVPAKSMPIYAALKSGLENLCRNMAGQLGKTGVTVNNLSPGIIETDRNTEALADPDRRERARSLVPMARFGVPEDCVGAALLLCSDAGSYITGIDLPVDGGMRLP